MIKRRLEKLEQIAVAQSKAGESLYLVRQNKELDLMSIRRLNFIGTIKQGEEVTAGHPRSQFIYMNVPDSSDEWKAAAKQRRATMN